MPVFCRAPEGKHILKVLEEVGFFQVWLQRNYFPPLLGHEAAFAVTCSAASFFPFGKQTMPAPSALRSVLILQVWKLAQPAHPTSITRKGEELGKKTGLLFCLRVLQRRMPASNTQGFLLAPCSYHCPLDSCSGLRSRALSLKHGFSYTPTYTA